jgi:hypothetical protein
MQVHGMTETWLKCNERSRGCVVPRSAHMAVLKRGGAEPGGAHGPRVHAVDALYTGIASAVSILRKRVLLLWCLLIVNLCGQRGTLSGRIWYPVSGVRRTAPHPAPSSPAMCTFSRKHSEVGTNPT